jgi:hypothetical protein
MVKRNIFRGFFNKKKRIERASFIMLGTLLRSTPLPPEICIRIDRLVRIQPLYEESRRIEEEGIVVLKESIIKRGELLYKRKSEWKNGTKHGVWMRWTPTDRPTMRKEYKDGLNYGVWKYFHHGRLHHKREYDANGDPCGVWTTWDDDGSIARQQNHNCISVSITIG